MIIIFCSVVFVRDGCESHTHCLSVKSAHIYYDKQLLGVSVHTYYYIYGSLSLSEY